MPHTSLVAMASIASMINSTGCNIAAISLDLDLETIAFALVVDPAYIYIFAGGAPFKLERQIGGFTMMLIDSMFDKVDEIMTGTTALFSAMSGTLNLISLEAECLSLPGAAFSAAGCQ